MSATIPAWPPADHTLYGTCYERNVLAIIRESVKHPGYYDFNVSANSEITSFTRPIRGSELGAEMVAAQIQDVAPGVNLKWTTHHSPRSEPQPQREYIYFIADEDGYIKIGHAGHPQARLKSLQTASRQELRLLATTPGAVADEKALHAKFSDDHVRGEWFKPSRELCEYIQEVSK